jgi:hypothetical protein
MCDYRLIELTFQYRHEIDNCRKTLHTVTLLEFSNRVRNGIELDGLSCALTASGSKGGACVLGGHSSNFRSYHHVVRPGSVANVGSTYEVACDTHFRQKYK